MRARIFALLMLLAAGGLSYALLYDPVAIADSDTGSSGTESEEKDPSHTEHPSPAILEWCDAEPALAIGASPRSSEHVDRLFRPPRALVA